MPIQQYNFDQWNGKLPKVSCQCLTYARTDLLDEAVESFLRQDYPGEKELVILNDYDQLEIRSDIPNVKVINLPYRMRTIGEKRNACVAMCDGDIIFPWDDDDIHLPHRISYSIEHMTNHHYYKPDKSWVWDNGVIRYKTLVAPSMGAWSKTFFDDVRGYPPINCGEDQAIENAFHSMDAKTLRRIENKDELGFSPRRAVQDIPVKDIFYIYRFNGTKSYHLSCWGWNDIGFQKAAEFASKYKIEGIHEISPHWSQDFIQMTEESVSENVDQK